MLYFLIKRKPKRKGKNVKQVLNKIFRSCIFTILILLVLTSCTGTTYTVTFDGEGGTLVSGETRQKVKQGESAIAPTFEKEGYDFVSWDKSFDNVKSNLEVKAIWQVKKYTVTFVNHDDTVLSTIEVEYNNKAVYNGPIPEKDLGDNVPYIFIGWNKPLDNIKSDLTVKALFAKAKYTYTFLNYDNEVLKTETVDFGSLIVPPNPPTKPSTSKYYYEFVGWDNGYTEGNVIVEDITFKAIFKEIEKPIISGISFYSQSFTYDGSVKEIEITGTLPEGVSVQYEGNNQVNAGIYTVVAKFTDTTGTYQPLEDMVATLTIEKATYNMSGITFNSETFAFDGTEKEIVIKGTLPGGVTVQYENNKAINVGEYHAVARFILADATNYHPIPEMHATLKIIPSTISGISFSDKSFIYDGREKSIFISGDLPDGVSVEYIGNGQTDAGEYKVIAKFTDTTGNYSLLNDLEAYLIIEKATYDISDISFTDVSFDYDGTEKEILITGELPEGVTVTYLNNKGINAGEYQAVAQFAVLDPKNYNPIENLSAKLTINKILPVIAATSIEVTYDGLSHSIVATTNSDGVLSYENNDCVNAGTYTVLVKVSEGKNYLSYSKEFTITINPILLSIEWVGEKFIFDGQTHKVTPVVSGIITGDDVDFVIEDNEKVECGEYIAQIVELIGDDAINYRLPENSSHNWLIEKATPVLEITDSLSKEYDGQSVDSPSFNYTGDGIITITYVGIEETDYPESTVAPVNAGSYRVKVVAGETNNFAGAKQEMDFVIRKAIIRNIEFKDATYTYDGKLKTLTFSGNLPEGVTFSYINNGHVNAGEYEVTLQFKVLNPNYEDLPDMTATLTIEKAKYDMSGVSFNNVTTVYTGEPVFIIITGTLPHGVNVTYINNQLTNVGTIEATAVFTVDSDNYYEIGSMQATLTITPKPLDVPIIEFDGLFVEWEQINQANRYIVEINGIEYTTSNLFYALEEEISDYAFTVRVKAIPSVDNTNYMESEYSNLIQKLPSVTDIIVGEQDITWAPVENAENYEVNVNGYSYPTDEPYFSFASWAYGDLNIEIIAKGLNDKISTIDSNPTIIQLNKLTNNVFLRIANNQIVWNKVANASKYILTINEQEFELDSTVNNYYLDNDYVGLNYIKLKVKGDLNKYLDSNISETFPVQKLSIVENLKIEKSVISWDPSPFANRYRLVINNQEFTTSDNEFVLDERFNEGEFTIKVRAESTDSNVIYSEYCNPIQTKKLGNETVIWVDLGILYWNAIDNAVSYRVKIGDYFHESFSTTYVVTDPSGTYDISVQAVGDGTEFVDGNFSQSKSFTKISTPQLTYNQGIVSWNVLPEAVGYTVYRRGVSFDEYTYVNEFQLPLDIGSFSVTVLAIGDEQSLSSLSYYGTPQLLEMPTIIIDGDYISWSQIEKATDFILIIDNERHYLSGEVTNFKLGEEYSSGKHTIRLVAIQETTEFVNYAVTGIKEIEKLAPVTSINNVGGILVWNEIEGATGYEISIGSSKYRSELPFYEGKDVVEDGMHMVSVKALNGIDYINSDDSVQIQFSILESVSEIEVSGKVITWDPINNSTGYCLEVNGIEILLENNYFEFDETYNPMDYKVRVRAIGNNSYLSSAYTDIYSLKKLAVPNNMRIEGGMVMIDPVAQASGYSVQINGLHYLVNETSFYLPKDVSSTEISISIMALGNNRTTLDSDYNEIKNYTCLEKPSLTNEGVKLSWSTPSNGAVTKFLLYINDNPIDVGLSTTYEINEVGVFKIYVRAVGSDSIISSVISNEINFTVQRLDTPTNLVLENQTLRWDQVTNASKYLVKVNDREITVSNNFIHFDLNFPVDIYTVSVQAKAHDLYLVSDFSESKTLTKLDVPLNMRLEDGFIKIDPVSNASGYCIEINGKEFNFWSQDTAFYVPDEIKTYILDIRISALGDNQAFISSDFCEFKQFLQLTEPTLTVTDRTLTWDSKTDSSVTSYLLYLNDTEIDLGKAKTYTINEPGVYEVKVRAIGSNNRVSSVCSNKETVVVYRLDTPNNIVLDGNMVKWNQVPYASGYIIKVNNLSYYIVDNYYSFETFEPGIYNISLQAHGSGIYLSSFETDVYTITKLATPTNLRIENGFICVDPVENALGYYLEIDGVCYLYDNNPYFYLPQEITVTEFSVRVAAYGEEGKTINSNYTELLDCSRLETPEIWNDNRYIHWSITSTQGLDYFIVYLNDEEYVFDALLTTGVIENPGDFEVSVRAIGSSNIVSSTKSESIFLSITQLPKPSNVKLTDTLLTWDEVEGAIGYMVMLGIDEPVFLSEPSYDLGVYEPFKQIGIQAIGEGLVLSSELWLQPIITLDPKGGVLENTVLLASFDGILNLEVPTKKGNTFLGWYMEDQQITDRFGKGLNVITFDHDVTLSARWGEFITYVENGITYMEYGLYPQKKVTISSIISQLETITQTNDKGYIELNGEQYLKSNGNYFLVEPIKWRVINEGSNSFTLLSELIIDAMAYDSNPPLEANFSTSTIRNWLNNNFYNQAFSKELQDLIKQIGSDKVSLLTRSEADSFLKTSKRAKITDYAISNGGYVKDEFGLWWLKCTTTMEAVNYEGGISTLSGPNFAMYGVRPVIVINLN